MHVADFVQTIDRPLVSFEFSPPRSEKIADKFNGIIDNLIECKPDFVSVTFGAGGSTKEGSYQLVDKLKNEIGLPTVAYIAGYGLGPDEIVDVLDGYKKLGIKTIFVIRGDAPQGKSDFQPHPDTMHYASDMISHINDRYDFCIGAAGYPEGHIDAISLDKDLEYLKLKVDNGAQFVISQYVYDVAFYTDFIKRARDIGINVPILAGVMPIYTEKMTRILSGICGTTITGEINDALAGLPVGDKQAVLDFGVDIATKQCRQLLEHGVDGLHFYTMGRSKTVIEVIRRLKAEGSLK